MLPQSLQDDVFGNLFLNKKTQEYSGSCEFRVGLTIPIRLKLVSGGHGDIDRMRRFAAKQLVLLRAGELGFRGYRRKLAQQLLRTKKGPKTREVEKRLAESLQPQVLLFDDDGLSALQYSSSQSDDVRAVVAIDRTGRITNMDTLSHSTLALWQTRLEKSFAAAKAATPQSVSDPIFGHLVWNAKDDCYRGWVLFHKSQPRVRVVFYLWGSNDTPFSTLRKWARQQLLAIRRTEQTNRTELAAILAETIKPRRSSEAIFAALRIQTLVFDDEGQTSVQYRKYAGFSPAIEVGTNGKLLAMHY